MVVNAGAGKSATFNATLGYRDLAPEGGAAVSVIQVVTKYTDSGTNDGSFRAEIIFKAPEGIRRDIAQHFQAWMRYGPLTDDDSDDEDEERIKDEADESKADYFKTAEAYLTQAFGTLQGFENEAAFERTMRPPDARK
ncbi:hypothetical protein K461DRAFT_291129 [Myriangium duriaei CBS 260.36]|uniref:Uncharacterized protein n=1 Tax=Myriangium duriaei CBS 260.36 TaxID=1168546 RepID=A0A9P4JC77_9PEZI|nr:hypothetical protein K461DRAFT_291129 [Myriangium duriaei CBS 260.36]